MSTNFYSWLNNINNKSSLQSIYLSTELNKKVEFFTEVEGENKNIVVTPPEQVSTESTTSEEQTVDQEKSLKDEKQTVDQEKSLCRLAFDYYDLYDSSNPFVIKGNDINYSFKNNIASSDDLVKIGYNNSQTFNKYVENYNPNNIDETEKAINKLFENTPLKLGCCFRKSSSDNGKRSVVVRTPLNPYDSNVDSDLKKFDFKFKTLTIPENSCPANYYGDSIECNTLYEVYCKNIINEFDKKGLPLDDFKKYSPECACYAPKYEKEKIYPDNTPPACYKYGCENRNNIAAYVDPISRNNPCDITVCQNILSLQNVSAGGNINVDAKLQNSCGEYLPGNKSTNKVEDPDLVTDNVEKKNGTSSTGGTSGAGINDTNGTGGTSGSGINDKTGASGTNTGKIDPQSNMLLYILIPIICSFFLFLLFIFMSRKNK